MTVRVTLQDANTGRAADVSPQGAQAVYQIAEPLPDLGTKNRLRFFRSFALNSAASSNMNVNGSVTPQLFTIDAAPDYDIYITKIIMVIADTLVRHGRFGNVPQLANGFDLIAFESGEETPLINKAKTGGEMLAQSGLLSPFGNGTEVNELSDWREGTEDAQIVTIPIADYVRGGLRLGRGNTDQLRAVVNDDLTGLTEFTVLALGMRLYP